MSKMALHEPFWHLQHKLCAKEGSGVKLAIWLSATKSRESTQPWCVQVECDTPLKRSQGKLQVCFRPHLNWRSEQGVMSCQSLGSPNRDSFETPPWESRKKVSFGCGCDGVTQRIIWGKVVASLESRPWWVLWVQSRQWFILAPRVFQKVN
jgi:hypothetical protein